MNIFDHFNVSKLNNEFTSTVPHQMVVLDNFLPEVLVAKMFDESQTIPEQYWKTFTRRGSKMLECNNMTVSPAATEFINQLHSQEGMAWLSSVTGIENLIPDPYLVGAGYSKITNGSSLKVHTDFNWNDTLKLHRVISLVLYLTPNWKEEYGGTLNFYDYNNEHIVKSVPSLYNRAIIWKNHERCFHGCPEPVTCPPELSRNAFRLFFYVANTTGEKVSPHRSLYWYDRELNKPYDVLT